MPMLGQFKACLELRLHCMRFAAWPATAIRSSAAAATPSQIVKFIIAVCADTGDNE